MKVPFYVKSLYEYKSEYDDDLSFAAGKVIQVTEIEDDEWYSGVLDGKLGMFPRNFVEVVEANESSSAGKQLEDESRPVTEPIESSGSAIESKQPEPESPVESKPVKPESPIESKQPKPATPESPKQLKSPVNPSSLPIFPKTQREDPYAVKKAFIAEAKSSYVPQVKPRDDSFLIGGHGSHSQPQAEVYKEDMEKPEEVPEEKLSLKERIALLQKKQQEEAEREAAALKRQEERKQKAAEEKARRLQEQQEKEERIAQGLEDPEPEPEPEIQAHSTGASKASVPESVEQEPEDLEPEEAEGDETDDEELRRRKLVERMAKISGGRNMFGMMGMSPFGAGAGTGAAKKEKKEKKPEPVAEESTEKEPEESQPVPIMPFADPAALEKLKKPAEPEEKEFVDAEEDIEAPTKEDSSMGEDDNPTESEARVSLAPIPQLDKPVIESDSGVDTADDIKLEPIEKEATGYDADEESGKEGIVPEVPRSVPEVPRSVPEVPRSVPEVPRSVPEVPRSVPEVPRSVPEVPKSVPEVPKSVPEVPRTAPEPPRSVPEVPRTTPEVPKTAPEPPRSVPEIPSVPPVPSAPVPVPETAIRPNEEYLDSLDDEFEFSNQNLPPPIPESKVPEPPTPSVPAVPPPVSHVKRASTDGSALTRNTTGSSLGSLRRSSTEIRKGLSQAEQVFDELELETANISSTSSWWLNGVLPDFLARKVGVDLTFEVESNTIQKRGNRSVVYTDYYILFSDLSSVVMELEYETQDPRSTVRFTNLAINEVPIIRKDLLDKYYKKYGSQILKAVSSGGTLDSLDLIEYVFGKLDSSALQPIGSKGYGLTIYKNLNNHNISKVDEIRPGDILGIKNGKFSVHKGLGSKTVLVGEDSIFAAVVTEYDSKKDKFKVVEMSHGQLKKETYKMSEMKSGQVRVFRVVGRDYVGW